MFDEKSLFWAFANPFGFFLLVVACDALPNEEFEVELAVYAGRQLGQEIVWVDSFAVEDLTLDDFDDLEELATYIAECPVMMEKAKRTLQEKLKKE